MDDFDLSRLLGSLEDLEDYDLFGSGGGMELESDPQDSLGIVISKLNLSDGVVGNGIPPFALQNGVGTIAGEHPYGEHPSRTLFVRNINSNVEDIELRTLYQLTNQVLATDSNQGEKEFQTEVMLLGRLHHRNLVNLVGYCAEKRQHMLIYVYMSKGSLASHLYSNENNPVSWDLRVHIALDVARGLEYLHDGV